MINGLGGLIGCWLGSFVTAGKGLRRASRGLGYSGAVSFGVCQSEALILRLPTRSFPAIQWSGIIIEIFNSTIPFSTVVSCPMFQGSVFID